MQLITFPTSMLFRIKSIVDVEINMADAL